MNSNVVQENEINKYKAHKIKIGGKTYITKIDKKTNKEVFKRQFSVSLPNVENPPRLTTTWQSSITKVNKEVERIRSEVRKNKQAPTKKVKHLYEDIVQQIYKEGVELSIKKNETFDTIEKFLSNNNKYVLNNKMPYNNFKHKNIEDLTIYDIKTLKQNINSYALEKNLSKITVTSIFGNIDRVLKWSSEKMYIDDSLAYSVRIIPQGKEKSEELTLKNYLLDKEFEYMMNHFDKFKFTKKENDSLTDYRRHLYKSFLICAFLLGFRRGEGFGLKWGDYTEEEIHISCTLNAKFVKKHTGKSERYIKTKTKSGERIMKTPITVKKCLKEWKEYCNSLGIDTSNDQPIFREANGQTLKATTFGKRLELITLETGVNEKFNKHIYPHSFRHSCCSFLIEKLKKKDPNISLRDIANKVGRYLGHADDKMVYQVYGHLYPLDDDDILIQLLDEI